TLLAHGDKPLAAMVRKGVVKLLSDKIASDNYTKDSSMLLRVALFLFFMFLPVKAFAEELNIRWHAKEVPAPVLPEGWRYCGGGWLESDDARFGGLSGVAMGEPGELWMVSDHGYFVTLRLKEVDGVVQGVEQVRFHRMLGVG